MGFGFAFTIRPEHLYCGGKNTTSALRGTLTETPLQQAALTRCRLLQRQRGTFQRGHSPEWNRSIPAQKPQRDAA
jgi:hypothetical protein